jgi:hypothetical protein
MSMDDILKLLVESRQTPQTQHPAQQSDPMTDLIGGLLGGGGTQGGGSQQSDAMTNMIGSLLGGNQQQSSGNQQSDAMVNMIGGLLGGSQQQSGGSQQTGLSTVMGLLEMVTSAGQQGLGQTSMAGNNPIMGMLQPFVAPLAKKLKISPEIAMIVVSFVVQKMLAHHPTSERDSTQFDLDDLLKQVGSGSLSPGMLQNSGMVDELSRATGLDHATATKSLDAAFNLVGQKALGGASASMSAKPAPGRMLKSAASSAPKKITRE